MLDDPDGGVSIISAASLISESSSHLRVKYIYIHQILVHHFICTTSIMFSLPEQFILHHICERHRTPANHITQVLHSPGTPSYHDIFIASFWFSLLCVRYLVITP